MKVERRVRSACSAATCRSNISLTYSANSAGMPEGFSKGASSTRGVLLGALDLPLDLAHAAQVLVELAPVRGPELARERLRAAQHHVEDAPAVGQAPRARRGVERDVVGAEQPLERHARVRLRRHRGRVRAPRDAVGVGAAVARVAVADGARLLAAELKRGEPGLVAHRPRRHLVDRDAVVDVRTGGLARVDARQVRAAGARVVARPVAERVAVLVGEAGDDHDPLAIGLERLQDPRQLEVASLALGRPVGGR